MEGVLAGAGGVAAMTLGEKLEQRLTSRPNSYLPAHTLERLLGLSQRRDSERQMLNLAMHVGQAILRSHPRSWGGRRCKLGTMAQQEESSALEGGSEADGGALLARISNEMVQAQKQFFGKGPTKAKSYMLDDMLIIVMRGGMTTAEKTMLDFGNEDQVRQFRQLFENEMTERLTDKMEALTGRKIVNYQSQVMFDPDIVVEMFVFDAEGRSDAIEATAEGQLEGTERGMATDEDALDTPSSGGE